MAGSRDDGDGCRSFDLELLASIVPPEERRTYLAFLEATQCPQGLGGHGAALARPFAPRRALHLRPVTEDNVPVASATQREMAVHLGVEPVELASDHAVFYALPRELAGILAAWAGGGSNVP